MIIKRTYSTCGFLLVTLLFANSLSATLNYTMTPSVPGYTALTGAINIGDLAAGSDATISQSYTIGFGFVFDGTTYTEFQVSDNGFVHLGNNLSPTGYGSAGGDVVIPNNFTAANTLRPFIAPLWEDLATANIGGSASYKLTGSAPNRTLTIEWNKMSWRFSTGTDQLSFQVKLYETTNIIDFIYKVGPVAIGTLPTASIGLGGIGAGNFYSLNNSGGAPAASLGVNTTSINTKPADGQRYRWAPPVVAPIELLFFKGKNMEAGNIFEWKTASEINNDYFTLERSDDASYFEPVDFIKGAGNSNTLKSYTYTDVSFSTAYEILYYRLKQTDYDQTFNYSPIISIDISGSSKKPPAIYFDINSKELIISYNFIKPKTYRIEIIDMLGHLIYSYPLEIISTEKKICKVLLPFTNEGVLVAKISESEGTVLAQSKFIK